MADVSQMAEHPQNLHAARLTSLLASFSSLGSLANKTYYVPFLTFPVAALLAWYSFGSRSLGMALLGLFIVLIGISPLPGTKNGLVLMSSLTLSLAMGEISLQIFQNDEETTYSPESDYAKPDYHLKSDVGDQALPGNYSSKKLTSKGETVYDVVYSIGQDRFRITPGMNGPVRARINFFGCSFMFGEGVNDNETLPSFLHAMNTAISVKNFGWHGYGVHQALRILESNRDTSGDVNFLLTAPWHAERSACVPYYSMGSPRYALGSDGSVELNGICGNWDRRNVLARVINHSHIYQLIRRAMDDSQDEQIRLYLAIIRKIHKISESRSQKLVVGFIKADEKWFAGKYSNGKIFEHLQGMGIDVLDLTLAESEDRLPREYYIHPLDKHPSPKANEARARLLNKYLEGIAL